MLSPINSIARLALGKLYLNIDPSDKDGENLVKSACQEAFTLGVIAFVSKAKLPFILRNGEQSRLAAEWHRGYSYARSREKRRSAELSGQPGAFKGALRAKRLSEDALSYVHEIVIEGSVARDMYDEHPGFAYFFVDASERYTAACSMSRAKEIALDLFERACAQNELEEETEGTYDGQFCPSAILLRDQFGNVVQKYSAGSWQSNLPAESEWAFLEEKASALEDEASEEARWDNFDSANRLRARARALRQSVEMAQAASRVLH